MLQNNFESHWIVIIFIVRVFRIASPLMSLAMMRVGCYVRYCEQSEAIRIIKL
jgi:hypothetical protein